VDPDDDSVDRGVVWWYRFDPEHKCRRNVVVAAYDNESEWIAEIQKLNADIKLLQAEGASDEREHAGGAWKQRGYNGEVAARRWGASVLRSRGSRRS
jgi:hypothetical protein